MEMVSGRSTSARLGEELAKPLAKEKHQAVAKHRGVSLLRSWLSSTRKTGQKHPGEQQLLRGKVQSKAAAKAKEDLKEAKEKDSRG